jgi:hypothetical protein
LSLLQLYPMDGRRSGEATGGCRGAKFVRSDKKRQLGEPPPLPPSGPGFER